MQVHQTQVNKGPKITANLAQRINLLEKKVEQLQTMSGATFAGPVIAGNLQVNGTSELIGGLLSPNSSLTGIAPMAAVDTSATTYAGSSPTIITNSWSIPAGDAVAATAYRIRAYGQGSVGAAATTIDFSLSGFSTATAGTGINSGAITSNSFGWFLEGIIVIVSGFSAHYNLHGIATPGAVTGGRSGTASIAFDANAMGVSITASSATTLSILGSFGTPGSGTTLTSYLSTFERI
jgi:hypothetical protein